MSDIYAYRAAFRAFRDHAPASDPALLRLLADLAAVADERAKGCTAERFATSLISALRQDAIFDQVGRVCLAQFSPHMPMLHVLGSANAVTVGSNTLRTGYYCFIADSGSLSSVQEGRARIYGDVRQITGSFSASGRPVQRTIRHIQEMGLRSGMCLPLHLGRARGLLFLNSERPDSFTDLRESHYLALTVVAQMATSFLLRVGATVPEQANWQVDTVLPGLFTQRLQRALQQRFGEQATVAFHTLEEAGYIWSPDLAVWAVVQAIDVLAGPGGPGQIAIGSAAFDRQTLALRVTMPLACSALDERLAGLRELLAPWRISLALSPANSGFELLVPADWDHFRDAKSCYSI
ncbi:MAG TPA: hypothetical protein DCS97_11420 [Planctomycetes bacterium]|nr:hypothetical protein [Planctomycetota bacterium]